MRLFFCIGLSFGISLAAAQFEVASLKPANPENPRLIQARDLVRTSMPAAAALPVKGRRVTLRGTTAEQLIAAAFRIRPRQISGPGWLKDQRFDLEAVIAPEEPIEKAPEMLQTLLKERFGLRTHLETRDQPGYLLIVDKRGHRLKEASQTPMSTLDPAQVVASAIPRKPGIPGSQRREMKGADMAQVADTIAGLLQSHVRDQTGLNGRYDVVLEVAPPRDADDVDVRPRVIDAVAMLGLRLTSGKIAVELLVIDNIEKTPIEN